MDERTSSPVEDRERVFFDAYYEGGNCNPAGLRHRYRRELGSLVRAAAGRDLGRVLSIGCGDGGFELMLAAHADRVVGIDLSREAVERARSRAEGSGISNVEFHCRPISQLDAGEPFDTIVCLAFLHHLPADELPGVLGSLRERLRPGGFFYSQDPNACGILRAIGRVLLGSRYDRYHSPDERELDPAELETVLRRAGFDTVRIGHIDLTLIPAQYLMPKAPGWLMTACARVDKIWCASPLARWSSGFTAVAEKAPRQGD